MALRPSPPSQDCLRRCTARSLLASRPVVPGLPSARRPEAARWPSPPSQGRCRRGTARVGKKTSGRAAHRGAVARWHAVLTRALWHDIRTCPCPVPRSTGLQSSPDCFPTLPVPNDSHPVTVRFMCECDLPPHSHHTISRYGCDFRLRSYVRSTKHRPTKVRHAWPQIPLPVQWSSALPPTSRMLRRRR